MARAVADRAPAMAASAALHAAVVICALISWPWMTKSIHMGDVVPVTLVTSADLPAAAPAVQAPQPAPAAAETPVAQAPPQPAAPQAAAAAPAAKAQPTPTPRKTAAAQPAPKPAPELNRAALLASLTGQTGPAHPSSAPRGATRPNQAVRAMTSSGVSNAASDAALASLSGELQRMWNPICSAPGAANVMIKVTFRLNSLGEVVGSPQSSQADATDEVVKVASERAVRPVDMASPFDDPAYRVLYGQTITVNFNQKSFCSNQ
jgi:hypothetical protein